MKIDHLPIGKVRLNPDNPRQIGTKEFMSLVKSLKDCPDMFEARPLLVSDRTGEHIVLGGNMRLRAAQKLGYKEVPAIILSGLTEAQEREIAIKDNGAWGEWDWDALANEWGDVPLAEWGVDIPTDWATDQVEPADAEPQIDKAAELNKKWKVKTGDLFTIGDHRLLCGDSTKREDVERVMGDEKAEAVVTDPPYGMNLNTDYSHLHGEGKSLRHEKVIGDDVPFDPGPLFSAFGYCKDMFLFGADYYLPRIPDWDKGSWLIWDKRVEEKYDAVIGSAFEVLWTKARHKKEILRFQYVNWAARMKDGEKFHPTMKPVDLIVKIILMTDANAIVDPYLSSGTTMVACQNLSRKCRGIEISPNYCAVILQRMTDAFPEIEIERVDAN
ncbi:MAG: DNA methyltransferase [Dehalococcoidia bacterium]